MNALRIILANVLQALHAFNNGMVDHRLVVWKTRVSGKRFHHVDSVECECGAKFFQRKNSTKQ